MRKEHNLKNTNEGGRRHFVS